MSSEDADWRTCGFAVMDPHWTLLIPSLVDEEKWSSRDSTEFFDTHEDAEEFITEYRGDTDPDKYTIVRMQSERE